MVNLFYGLPEDVQYKINWKNQTMYGTISWGD